MAYSYQKLYTTLPIGHMVAAWFLRDDDLSWLNKEFQKMYEFFKDSPALQWMEETGRADERRKAELQLQEARKQAEQQLRTEQKKAEQQLRAEQKRAEQQLRAAEKKAEQRLQDAEKEALALNRQLVMELIGTRFPRLLQLARVQVRLLKRSERCHRVIVQVGVARNIDEARDVLHSLTETEKEAG